MADTDEQPQTPDAFLKGVAAALQADEGIDLDLAKILSTEILIAKAPADAVSRAKAAIVALATKRAAPPESVDG
ncbi:hypothetical protein [Parvibaculum sp.]|uniref:hypothetical protein n=1 Tax=Parvibaculum sp. TaxID=2024848 RepID=UPI001D2676CA|nr:hypothetical protein [Parvibaculum sp.]MBX3488576.1 hypothetical protein [Parvibaculum sp.]